MESTVKDFWKMIVERECTAVVMLCGLEEDEQVKLIKLCLTYHYSVTLLHCKFLHIHELTMHTLIDTVSMLPVLVKHW